MSFIYLFISDVGCRSYSQVSTGSERDSSTRPSMCTEYQAANVLEQSTTSLEDQMSSLNLQPRDSPQANKGSFQNAVADLGTDTPDEKIINAYCLKKPLHDQIHLRRSSDMDGPLPKTTSTSSSNKDDSENIKDRLYPDLKQQQAHKAQGYYEPPAQMVDKDSKLQPMLRGYQRELVERANDGDNHIVCAPTGSGKSLVAAVICHNRYNDAKAQGNIFKALFVVSKRLLVEQFVIFFRKVFPDDTVASVRDRDRLSNVFYSDSHAVIVVTAQPLLNALKNSPPEINLGDISMIIFDECHHTMQDHPYNEIMNIYMKTKKLKLGSDGVVGKSGRYLPQILGISALLGVGHGKDAFQNILLLCANLDVSDVIQIVQNKDELQKYVKSPEQDSILHVPHQSGNRGLYTDIEKIMYEVEDVLCPDGVPEQHGTDTFEQWCINKSNEAKESQNSGDLSWACKYLLELNQALMLFDDFGEVEAVQHLGAFLAFLAKQDLEQNPVAIEKSFREDLRMIQEKMGSRCRDKTDKGNPMIHQLEKLLRKTFEEKPKSKG